jgi:colanic acid biosynthesis protein WcaH
MLPAKTFLKVVASTPLVAIDLIIENKEGRYLLGRRVNRPAQGFWFVPGGRIQKNEPLDEAFRRITQAELGHAGIDRANADLLGVYEHLYDDNFSGQTGISTHYVVLGYRLRSRIELIELPDVQHNAYRWATADEILSDAAVHANTRAYFDGTMR